METLADYGTVAYFAVDTFTTGIYRAWFSLGDRVAAAQLSTLLLAVRRRRGDRSSGGRDAPRASPAAPGSAACSRRCARGSPARAAGSRRPSARTRSSSASRCRCCCCCASCCREPGPACRSRASRELGWNSFRVAGIAAVLAVVLAVVVAYAVRLVARRAHPRRRAGCWRWATRCRAPCSPSACCCRSARWTSGSPARCRRAPACDPGLAPDRAPSSR